MHNTENVTDNEDDYHQHQQQHPQHHNHHNQNHQNSITTTTPAIGSNTNNNNCNNNNNGIIKIEYNNTSPQSSATTKTTTTTGAGATTLCGAGLSNNTTTTTTIGIKGEHNVNDDNNNNNIARICSKCKEPIKQRYLLKALDLFWHEDCLKCDCCECRLGEVGQTLYYKSNLILCKRDYLRMFGTQGTCTACGHIIPPFELVMRAKSNVYHLECFACQQCNHRFCVGDSYYLCDGKILCVYDYEERLLFASMPCNPSNLAHIRRQVSSLQPVGDNMNNCGNLGIGNGDHRLLPLSFTRQPIYSNEKFSINSHPQLSQHQHQHQQQHLQQQQQQHPSNIGHQHRDDGSSGYGSPDSETFETPPSQ